MTHQRKRRVEQCRAHVLGAAARCTAGESGHDADERPHARREVEHRRRQPRGRRVRVAGEAHQPGNRLHERVVTRHRGPERPVAEGGHAAQHDAGTVRAQVREAKLELSRQAGRKALDNDVGGLGELQQCGAPFWRANVEQHAAFVAIDREEHRRLVPPEGRQSARVVAVRRTLDFDDVCAHIAQHHRGEGCRDIGAQIEHPQAAVGVAQTHAQRASVMSGPSCRMR